MDEKIFRKIDNFFIQYKLQIYHKGEILIRADDDPSGIFYMKKGVVKEYAISKNGEELIVNLFKPPAFFPMSWALNGTPNKFFFEAVDQVEVYKAPKDEVIALVRKDPDILYDLMKRLYRGVDGLLMRTVYLMSGDAYHRLVAELLIFAKRFGVRNEMTGEIICKVTERDLAAQAGLTRETISREMKLLKEKKLVLFKNAQLSIMNLSKLEDELVGEFSG